MEGKCEKRNALLVTARSHGQDGRGHGSSFVLDCFDVDLSISVTNEGHRIFIDQCFLPLWMVKMDRLYIYCRFYLCMPAEPGLQYISAKILRLVYRVALNYLRTNAPSARSGVCVIFPLIIYWMLSALRNWDFALHRRAAVRDCEVAIESEASLLEPTSRQDAAGHLQNSQLAGIYYLDDVFCKALESAFTRLILISQLHLPPDTCEQANARRWSEEAWRQRLR
ncbi:hypothetical protein EGR_00008 [Echinococcus granulosus]|uniref:Uncharacterized protein n=1 Tax=Echinococcus granulosus TaxID=6210 RepID=W6VCU2_ECHGR|nr:hypothetical protein EGR_00008 [Echinococcus granulosus]EUB64739.1 hypothetical protein EGR_00008 [Echinococcus granulosus]